MIRLLTVYYRLEASVIARVYFLNIDILEKKMVRFKHNYSALLLSNSIHTLKFP